MNKSLLSGIVIVSCAAFGCEERKKIEKDSAHRENTVVQNVSKEAVIQEFLGALTVHPVNVDANIIFRAQVPLEEMLNIRREMLAFLAALHDRLGKNSVASQLPLQIFRDFFALLKNEEIRVETEKLREEFFKVFPVATTNSYENLDSPLFEQPSPMWI